jgi:membrane associated rhomboid family serine protease
MGRITETVKVLLIANILFFFGANYLGDYAYKIFALWFPENPNFGFWQILTHMFMHGSFSHILFNMFALYMFGSLIEQYLGQNKFLFIYFSAGLGAAGLQILFSYIGFNDAYQAYIDAGVSPDKISELFDSVSSTGEYRVYPSISQDVSNQLFSNYLTPMVGASGAIFGILVPIPIKAKYLIGGYFLMNLFSAITGVTLLGPSNTAYWAHIGGAVIGFITMYYWKKNSFNANRWN